MTPDNDSTGNVELETRLRAALDVTPSPEFKARVWAQIADGTMIRESAAVPWQWLVVGVPVAAAAIIIAALWLRPSAVHELPALAARPETLPDRLGHELEPTPPPVNRSNVRPPAATGHSAQVEAAGHPVVPSMEVLIPAYERRAIRAVLAASADGRLNGSSLGASQRIQERPPIFANLDQPGPLEIQPIATVSQ